MGKRSKRRYGNQGRDQINIERVNGDVLFNSQETLRPTAERDLLAIVRQWVKSRLEGQLHHAVRLNLKKETQPQQVRPWSMEVKVAIAQPSQLLPMETTIGQVFDQCSGRLLLLGEPGAGKTTSLLDLALELVERAEDDSQHRIPVVVDLSDWQPTTSQSTSKRSEVTSRLPGFFKKKLSGSLPEQAPILSIADWVTNKVRERYGILSKQTNQWLEDKRLIFLLDGLDEVRPEYQQFCVRAINQWLNSDLRPRQVALCCRREQYETYPEKLELDGAVYLQDLTHEQIQTFLSETNRDELKENFVADTNLLALIRRPLLLSMAVLAYNELEPTQWGWATSAGERLNLLLDAYVRRMLTQDTPSLAYRKGNLPSPEQSQKWLEILALQLLQESQTEFLIEQIQVTWLSTSLQKWLFSVCAVIFWGLICAVIFWGLIKAVIFWGRVIGLRNLREIEASSRFWLGFGIGSLYGLERGIDVWKDLAYIESVRVAIQIILSGLKPQKVLSKLSSWKAILIPTKINSLIYKLVKLTELKWGFNVEKWGFKVKTLSVPNQGIRNLWRNIIPITLTFVPLHTLMVCVVINSASSLHNILVSSLCIALLLWIVLGGGYVCINHFIIRLSLYGTSSIPWEYARFLNYATERLLLQRVGGRYRFMHDLLRQSLAQRRISTHSHLISSQAFFRCAESYRLMERYDEALQDYNRAIELDPKYKWAFTGRGFTYRSIERYEEALQDYNRAIELDPTYEWAFTGRGFTHYLMERYDEALQDYNCAIELDPKDERAFRCRGLTYRSIERYDEALQDYKRAIELDPKDWVFAERGLTYRLMERYDEALQDYNRAIELDPKYKWAFTGRGLTYRLMERYDEALQDYNRAIELDPKYKWAFTGRGFTYRSIERYEEALQDYNRAIELDPTYEWAFTGRGFTHYLMERYDEALQDYNCAIELDPKDDWCRYLRSLVYLVLHQAESAKADLDTAIQIAQQEHTENPDNCQNTFNLALYNLVAGNNFLSVQGIYQTALHHNASLADIRFAVLDLKDLLRMFPEQAHAQQMKTALEERLKLDQV